jgi:hypothetical protein
MAHSSASSSSAGIANDIFRLRPMPIDPKEPPPPAPAPVGKYPVGKYPIGKYPPPAPVVTKG